MEKLDEAIRAELHRHSAEDTVPDHIWAEVSQRVVQRGHRRSVRRRTVLCLSLVVLLVVAAVAVYSVVGNGSGQGTRAAGTWHLTGYVVAQSGTENEYGPTEGFLTCPTAKVCYDASPQISQVGTIDVIGKSVLFVSSDGGKNWVARDLPTGVTLTTRLQCVTVESCALGATGPGPTGSDTSQILTTSNGGESWTSHELPAGIGSLYALSCPSTETCAGLATENTFVETDNGGTTWSRYTYPADQTETAISCDSGSQCVVIGDEPRTTPGVGDYGVSWSTEDAGRSWRSSTITAYTFGQDTLACPTSVMCMTMAVIPHAITQCTPEVSIPSTTSTTVCVTGQGGFGEPAVTTNGGLTWKLESFPASVPGPGIMDVSCPTARLCWAAGSDDVANQRMTDGVIQGSGNSPIVLMSRDGGATWKAHTFSTPRTLPAGESFSGISQIQCQSSDSCVALGVDNEGSAHTLVYTFSG